MIAVLPGPKSEAEPDPGELLDALLETMSVRDAAAVASEKLHIPKKQAYALALERKAAQER